MKKDRVYNITVTISTETSNVDFAECSCPAGRGPHGSCKHIAATLFALESFHTFYEEAKTEDEIFCTSKLQNGINLEKDTWICSLLTASVSKLKSMITSFVVYWKIFFDPRPKKTTDKELK